MLSHTHPMSDPDAIFTIDPTTRVISTNVEKIILMQYDHNSEIFTFSIPQFVEGHNMSLCNKIEIHYTNINKRTREKSNDVYPVTDKQVGNDNLVFTWLLSGNATKYPGSLNFIIRFECVEDDGSISYMWNTDIFKNITVSDGISNTETVIEDYSDILEQWKRELVETCTDYANITNAPAKLSELDNDLFYRNTEEVLNLLPSDFVTDIFGRCVYNGTKISWLTSIDTYDFEIKVGDTVYRKTDLARIFNDINLPYGYGDTFQNDKFLISLSNGAGMEENDLLCIFFENYTEAVFDYFKLIKTSIKYIDDNVLSNNIVRGSQLDIIKSIDLGWDFYDQYTADNPSNFYKTLFDFFVNTFDAPNLCKKNVYRCP